MDKELIEQLLLAEPNIAPTDATSTLDVLRGGMPVVGQAPTRHYLDVPDPTLKGRKDVITEEIGAEEMAEVFEQERTKLHNKAILETMAQTMDPLGSLSEEVYGDEESLSKMLVAYADIPFNIAKGAAKGILSGGTSLAAVGLSVKPDMFKPLLENVKATNKYVIPNVANQQQLLQTIHNMRKEGPPIIQGFSDADIARTLGRNNNTFVGAHGSHHTLAGLGVENELVKRGLKPSPFIVDKSIRTGDPNSVFGIAPGQHYVAKRDEFGDLLPVISNEGGLETLLDDPMWVQGSRLGELNLQDVKKDLPDIVSEHKNKLSNLELMDIMGGVDDVTMYRGTPTVKGPTNNREAMTSFDVMASPMHSEAAQTMFGGNHPFDWQHGFVNKPSFEDHWKFEMMKELGTAPQIHNITAPRIGLATRGPEWSATLERMGDLSGSSSPVMRMIGDKVNKGDINPIIENLSGAKLPNTTFMEELNDSYILDMRDMLSKRGSPDVYPYDLPEYIQNQDDIEYIEMLNKSRLHDNIMNRYDNQRRKVDFISKFGMLPP